MTTEMTTEMTTVAEAVPVPLSSHSTLYTELSDHPDTVGLTDIFTTEVLTDPVIQSLNAIQPFPITADVSSSSKLKLTDYTRSGVRGFICPSLAPFSTEQLTDAGRILDYWQFPDPDIYHSAKSSVTYWKMLVNHELALRSMLAEKTDASYSALPKCLYDTDNSLYYSIKHIFGTNSITDGLLYVDIFGLRSVPVYDALLGRAGSFYTDYCKNPLTSTYSGTYSGGYPIGPVNFQDTLLRLAEVGETELMKWICETSDIGPDCLTLWEIPPF